MLKQKCTATIIYQVDSCTARSEWIREKQLHTIVSKCDISDIPHRRLKINYIPPVFLSVEVAYERLRIPQDTRNIFTRWSVTFCCLQVSAGLTRNDDSPPATYFTTISATVGEWHRCCIRCITSCAALPALFSQIYLILLPCSPKMIYLQLFIGKIKCVANTITPQSIKHINCGFCVR